MFSRREQLAAAGYTVYDAPTGAIPDGAELLNSQSLADWARAQHPVPEGGYDVITVSLGGNDIGFADVVFGCTDLIRHAWGASWRTFFSQAAIDAKDPQGCGIAKDELVARVEAMLEPQEPGERRGFAPGAVGSSEGSELRSLQQLYTSIADEFLAEDGVLVVMGYPRLLTPSETWGRWRGGKCNFLTADDADMLGAGAEEYDELLRDAVVGLDARFEYVSRLQIFDDGGSHHSLCAARCRVAQYAPPLPARRDSATTAGLPPQRSRLLGDCRIDRWCGRTAPWCATRAGAGG